MQPITDSKNLGLLIRNERKAQKLTQEQLAGLTGVGVRFVRARGWEGELPDRPRASGRRVSRIDRLRG